MDKRNRYPKGTRGLAAYELSVELAVNTLKILKTVHGPADLVNQAQRAVISIPLNIAEGAGRRGRDRSYHFTVAYGSGQELMAALEVVQDLELADDAKISDLCELLDRVNRVVWGLCKR